jgi:stress-induced morphogen
VRRRLPGACTLQPLTCLLAGGCGSFYAISITSSAFKDLPMIKQHRLVNDTLKQEIEGIHGLQVCNTALDSTSFVLTRLL